MLTRFFLSKSAKELGVDAKRITEGALDKLKVFGFPGNVRQLENICHWLTVMAPAQVIEAKDLPPELSASATLREPAEIAGAETLRSVQRPSAPEPVVPAPVAAPVVRSLPAHADTVLETGGAVLAEAASEVDRPVPLPLSGSTAVAAAHPWLADLEMTARQLLATGKPDVWDELSRQFEAKLIQTALEATRGRRIEAAQKLGIGRNTITRKIQDLGLE